MSMLYNHVHLKIVKKMHTKVIKGLQEEKTVSCIKLIKERNEFYGISATARPCSSHITY